MNTNESNATFGMSTVSATVGPTFRAARKGTGVSVRSLALSAAESIKEIEPGDACPPLQKELAMTATLTSLDVPTPAWATDRRAHLEEVGYRGLTFSRTFEVNENNSPLVIEQDISEDDGNHGTYIVAAPSVDLDWSGEANASDCRALAASLIEAADMLDSINAKVK